MAKFFPRRARAFLNCLTPVALLFAAAGVWAAGPAEKLLPSTASYTVNVNGMNASATRIIRPLSNDRWQADSNSSLLFFRIIERSEFKIHDKGVTPLHYFHDRTAGGDRNQNVSFDWANKVARNHRKVGSWEHPLEQPVWDKLSLQMQLRSDLLSGRFEDGSAYPILDRARLKTYFVEREGEESITLPSGTVLKTVKLRQFREGKERYTLVWLAPELNYLVVRIEHHDDDETNTLQLKSAQLDGRSVK